MTTSLLSLSNALEQHGATKAECSLFARRDIQSAADLLATPPRYIVPVETGRQPPPIGSRIAVVVRVTVVENDPRRNSLTLRGTAWGQPVEVVVFQKYWANILNSVLKKRAAVDMLCMGRLREGHHRAKYVLLASMIDFNRGRRTILPVYLSKPGDNEKFVTATQRILSAHDKFTDTLDKVLPIKMKADEMLRQLHCPDSIEAHDQAVQRYLAMAALLFMMRRDQTVDDLLSNPNQVDIHLDVQPVSQQGRLPFELSESQQKVIGEILNDLRQPNPTMRYVMGDVGAGKSVVAFETMAAVAAASKPGGGHGRAILLAPTVLLASQHYENFVKLYPEIADRTLLLTGHTPAGTKSDQYDVIIGTHAILNHKHLPADLLIVDEPQRFGLGQQRWNSPVHYVFLTATPLPRWTSLLLDGRVPVNMVSGRPRNVTNVPLSYSDAMLRKVLATLPQEQRRIIVTPWVQVEREIYPNLEQISAMLDEMGLDYLVVHGQMPTSEQLAQAARYRNRDCTLLLTTSLVETGLDIPDVKYMVVIAPEAFGYLGLYQLIGRTGRDGQQAYAYLLSTDKAEIVEYTQKVKNGYDAARFDLSKRGAGLMDDSSQSGLLRFPCAEWLTNETIALAKRAYQVLDRDPQLKAKARAELEVFLGRYFR